MNSAQSRSAHAHSRAERSPLSASSADKQQHLGGGQMMMADSGSTEEVAVIGNTDITSAESENNIINTVKLSVSSASVRDMCV